MITVSIEPHQLTAGRAAELGITLKNTGTGPCTNVVVKIDVPPGIRWLGGRERIQLDRLAGGDTFLHRLRVRPESAGEYVISSSNFSYCDPQGVSRRISGLALRVLVMVETPTPPARRPRFQVTLDTGILPHDAWGILHGRLKNVGELRLSNVAVSITGPLAVRRSEAQSTDGIEPGGQWEFLFYVKARDRGRSVPISVTTEYSIEGYGPGSRTEVIPVIVEKNPDEANISLTRILYLAASPLEMMPLRLGTEMRDIQQAWRAGEFRDEFDLVSSPAARVTDIAKEVINRHPSIIHFAGHGGTHGQLYAEDESGFSWPITVDGVVRLVRLSGNVKCVVISACHTEPLAHALGQHVRYVVGMHHAVGDRAAIGFSIGFYQALFARSPIEDAFMAGLAVLSARQQQRRDSESPFLLVDGQELAVDHGPERWVSIDVTATQNERAAVQALLDELDLGLAARADYASRAAWPELSWVITMAVPATTFLTAFAKKFGERVGDTAGDAADAVGRAFGEWVRRLYAARRGKEGNVTLYDRERGLDIVISRDLPARAYHELIAALNGWPDELAGRPTELRWSGDGWAAPS